MNTGQHVKLVVELKYHVDVLRLQEDIFLRSRSAVVVYFRQYGSICLGNLLSSNKKALRTSSCTLYVDYFTCFEDKTIIALKA